MWVKRPSWKDQRQVGIRKDHILPLTSTWMQPKRVPVPLLPT